MRAVYINLESATQRREQLDRSFASADAHGWELERFAGIRVADPSYSGPRLRHSGKGRTLNLAEEGCYLSHRGVVEKHAAGGEPFFVLEDDAVFARSSLAILNGFLSSNASEQWDLIFTDVMVLSASRMVDLVRLKQGIAPRTVKVIDLVGEKFAAASAYVVTRHGAKRLPELLQSVDCESRPYDMALRDLINRRSIRACVLFPFLTAVGESGNASQIQDTATSSADYLWNTFRRMVWIGSNREELAPTITDISTHYVDDEVRDLGVIVAAMASSRFKLK
ncbi:MAG: hypothetical protein JWQ07_1617 [Ramlibacter sp.]|nr:hypothetical protein [Ramlibacter sp.]